MSDTRRFRGKGVKFSDDKRARDKKLDIKISQLSPSKSLIQYPHTAPDVALFSLHKRVGYRYNKRENKIARKFSSRSIRQALRQALYIYNCSQVDRELLSDFPTKPIPQNFKTSGWLSW
jgi:hypothetical protein